MIQVDNRTGSDRLGKALLKSRQPVTMCRLEFGDASFMGVGVDQRPVPVGIEYKITSDALTCITDGRFAGHQLIGLTQSYEHVILLIEGVTRPSHPDGLLEVRHDRGFWYQAKVGPRAFMHRDFMAWLNTLTFKAGVKVIRTSCLAESASVVAGLYRWWTDGWESHKSHLALQSPIELGQVNFTKPSLARRVASCLPGIGVERSLFVSRALPTVFDMAVADESDWAGIDGVGKLGASKIFNAIRGVESSKFKK